MTEHTDGGGGWPVNPWRMAGWTLAVGLFLLPLVAMQFTDEVDWDETDFIFAGIMIFGTGIVLEIVTRMTRNNAYRGAVAVALASGFILTWGNAAVGVIGSEDNPLNLMFGGVIAIGIIGALISRFGPRGMARTMVAMAVAQTLAAVVALIAGYFTLFLNGFFVAMWLLSAHLFRKAARQRMAAAGGARE